MKRLTQISDGLRDVLFCHFPFVTEIRDNLTHKVLCQADCDVITHAIGKNGQCQLTRFVAFVTPFKMILRETVEIPSWRQSLTIYADNDPVERTFTTI